MLFFATDSTDYHSFAASGMAPDRFRCPGGIAANPIARKDFWPYTWTMDEAGGLSTDQFKRIMSQFTTGITVVTVRTEDFAAYGVTVNSFASVSLVPLLVLICLDNHLSGIQFFKTGEVFGVSVLTEEQEPVSRYFAKRGLDKSEASYFEGRTGVPLIQGALATLECEIAAAYPAGDHTIFVGEVKAGEIRPGSESEGPLVYFRSQYRKL